MRSPAGPGFWYVVFFLQSVVQLLMILRDWYRDFRESDGWRTAVTAILTSWLEFIIITVILLLLILGTTVLPIILTVLLVLVAAREVMQMSVSLKRYIFSTENWLELTMLALVAVILFLPNETTENACEVKRHLAAITIFLSWATLVTLVGGHPKLSKCNIYVTMFYKVLRTFTVFLLWYSFFIIAFGLGFYIMLHKDIVPDYTTPDEEYKFFNNPWLSMVKTFTMFVGELEFSDIPVNMETSLSPVSYAFLLVFIFLIVVVLMNLLNGLAVSDTGIIREKAEVVTYISQVEKMSCTESVLLGDPFDFLSNFPVVRYLREFPSLAFCRSIHRSSAVRDISHRITGATGILLFYTFLPDKVWRIEPNKHRNTCTCWNIEDMGEVIEAAKNIVVKKNQAMVEEDNSEMALRMRKVEEGQEKIEKQMDEISDKIDLILRKLTTNN